MTCPRHVWPSRLVRDAETESVVRAAWRAADEMRGWPGWKRAALGLPEDPGPPIECTCTAPEDRSDAAVRFSLLELE